MREIRAKLAQPVVESPPDMDETFHNALQQLKYDFFFSSYCI